MATQETRAKIKLCPDSRQQGEKICRSTVKKILANYRWISGNLPENQKKALYALLNHLIRSLDYLNLESVDGLPLDVWCEFRDDLSEAFQGKFASADLVSLVLAVEEFNVPRQYLFDMLDGVDCWIRNREFKTFDELLVFAYRIGGAPLVAAVPICGFVKDGYEEAAVKAGQAVFLTQILANIVHDFKLNKIFFAKDDIVETELSMARVKVRRPSTQLKHLVRLYGSRIEKLMYDGGKLIEFLDFDAQRSFKSLLAVHWKMLMKMRLDPDTVLDPDGVLSRRELIGLKTRHLLGTEGNVPVIPVPDDHH